MRKVAPRPPGLGSTSPHCRARVRASGPKKERKEERKKKAKEGERERDDALSV